MHKLTLRSADGFPMAARVSSRSGSPQGWRVTTLGHSLGAQFPGLLANQDKVSGLLGVAAGIASLVALYENAPHEVRSVAPADVGVRRIGHFGAFRHEQATGLWPRMADWLHSLATHRTA